MNCSDPQKDVYSCWRDTFARDSNRVTKDLNVDTKSLSADTRAFYKQSIQSDTSKLNYNLYKELQKKAQPDLETYKTW